MSERTCVVCGKPIENPEPGIDYCSKECCERERETND